MQKAQQYATLKDFLVSSGGSEELMSKISSSIGSGSLFLWEGYYSSWDVRPCKILAQILWNANASQVAVGPTVEKFGPGGREGADFGSSRSEEMG